MEQYNMVENVRALLNSPLSLGHISRETGVNLSTLKLLSSNRQQIENTRFVTVQILNNYWLEKKSEL